LYRRWFGRKRLVILLYHRLSPADGDSAVVGFEFDDPVPVDRFEHHLRILRWFGEPLSLDRACEQLHDANDRARSLISVTFDDGYRDNYTLGRSVWRRHGVPVTLFPAIAPIASGDWLWWDELQQIVGAAELDKPRVLRVVEVVDEITSGSCWSGDLQASDARERFARFLFARLLDLPAELRDTVLEAVADHLEVSRPNRPARVPAASDSAAADRLYMNWNELAEIAGEGVEIGGHTINHPRLPREAPSVAKAEIGGCRDVLQATLRRPVNSFAFPGGFYDTRELELLRDAGYRIAVTVEKGVNYPETDPLRLRRLALSWDEPHHLAFKLAFADWLFVPARQA
jgi:peptidoglycan/xylan/chitin deacetylase (PgdA/CDA1 family)